MHEYMIERYFSIQLRLDLGHGEEQSFTQLIVSEPSTVVQCAVECTIGHC